MIQPEASPKPKYTLIDRSQIRLLPLDYDCLIPCSHAARGIWELLGRLNLTAFEADSRSFEGFVGRPGIAPQLLASLWIYGYSIGVASARALERMMSWEPGLRWLCADQEVNHHTLSDFRMVQKERLDDLFRQVLAVLQGEGLVDLKIVTQDGTKVRARAGKQSLHRRGTIEQQLALASRYMEEMDRRAEEDQAQDRRHIAAQQRTARERLQRAQAALVEVQARQQSVRPGKRADVRVSTSETEASKMKFNDGAYAPGRNVQFSTDAKAGVIVAVHVSTAPTDMAELEPALAQIVENCGRKPDCLLADNGYVSRENVEAMAQECVEFVAPWKDTPSRQAGACATNGIDVNFSPSVFVWDGQARVFVCPAGKVLTHTGVVTSHGQKRDVFSAAREDCAECAFKDRCCGKTGAPRSLRRTIESPAMLAHLERMSRPETKALYKKRSVVAETPHMRIKENWGWRRFSVRGLANSAKEAIWVAIAYNVHVWTRFRRIQQPVAA